MKEGKAERAGATKEGEGKSRGTSEGDGGSGRRVSVRPQSRVAEFAPCSVCPEHHDVECGHDAEAPNLNG